MPRVGRKRKKKHTEKEVTVSEKEKKDTPRCFVIKRGNVGQRVKDLVQDFRMVMMPNSAKSLKESKMNRVEDFIAVAGHYGVSHLVIFTTTKVGTYMKLAKLPQGPTLTFKVLSFSLTRSIRAMQKRPRSASRDFTSAALQVLNGFGGGGGTTASDSKAGERQLTAEMLRGLFPAIEVSTFNQSECRRVALFSHGSDKDSIEFRHYSVARRQTGLKKSISALLNPARLPKLGGKLDVADFVLGAGGEESDPEDMEADSTGGGKVGVRLTEVGPRLQLQLVKGEEGVLGGAVLFHRYLNRTASEQEVLEQRATQRRKLKARNDRLDTEARAHNAKLKQFRQDKEKAAASHAKRAAGIEEVDEDSGGEDGGPDKKRKFNPFGFNRKAGGEKTVEIDDRPSKQRNRRGGQRQQGGEDNGGKGGGKGGKQGGKGGKGSRKGKSGKGGKGGGAQDVLNRFQKSQRR